MEVSSSSPCQRDDEAAHPTTNTTAASRTNIVPLIVARYQKKQRSHNHMEITDSSEDRPSATKALQQHTREILTIRNGPVRYEQEMFFHPYELYKHGKHQIHTRSVGYSSECDLVITREAISEPSDIDLGFVRRRAELDKAICLDPGARRPMTDGEVGKKLRFNAPRYRKYPGIRAPKNRKERNRLLNDYFSTEYARKIMEKYRERYAKGKVDEDLSPPIRPAFGNLPSVFYDIIDLDEDAQTRALESCGAQPRRTTNCAVKDPDSGESRFQNLNSRLRGELVHALNSDFLSRQIDDLERAFSSFIADGRMNEPLVYHFRDGYGRLVCHGVAAYYLLLSESQIQPDGTKITIVSWPKRKKNNCNLLTLPKIPLMSLLRKKRCDMGDLSSASTVQSTPIQQPEEAKAAPASFSLDETPGGSASPAGSIQAPRQASTDDEVGNQSVAVYAPAPLGSSCGEGMTATQKKKMRKALRVAQCETGSTNRAAGKASLLFTTCMSSTDEKRLWDVTYILSDGTRFVYRHVPLGNMDDLICLTRDAAKTGMKMDVTTSSTAEMDRCSVLPGFVIHHMPPKGLENLGVLALKPDDASWRSLRHRQGNAACMLLQILPEDGFTSSHVYDATTPVHEYSVERGRSGDGRPRASSPGVEGKKWFRLVPFENEVAVSGKRDGATTSEEGDSVRMTAGRSMNTGVDVVSSSGPKLYQPEPPLVLQRLREHVGVLPCTRNISRPHSFRGDSPGSTRIAAAAATTTTTTTSTVRVVALAYALTQIRALLQRYDAEGVGMRNPTPYLTRDGIVYLAAAVVKCWQMRLMLSPNAMGMAWDGAPPLVRDAQYEYLKHVLSEFTQRLDEVTLQKRWVEKASAGGRATATEAPEASRPLSSVAASPLPYRLPPQLVERQGLTSARRSIVEVTYCSSSGPLPLPDPLPPSRMKGGGLSVSLNAPQHADVWEELIVVGTLRARNPIGLFWWALEKCESDAHNPHAAHRLESSSLLLPLDVLYRQGCVTTFQITPYTFLLGVKPGLLQPSRRYRFVVEACDVRAGDVAFSEITLNTVQRCGKYD